MFVQRIHKYGCAAPDFVNWKGEKLLWQLKL